MALKKLGKKLTGKSIESDNTVGVINEIADNYTGGSGGSSGQTLFKSYDARSRMQDLLPDEHVYFDAEKIKQFFINIGFKPELGATFLYRWSNSGADIAMAFYYDKCSGQNVFTIQRPRNNYVFQCGTITDFYEALDYCKEQIYENHIELTDFIDGITQYYVYNNTLGTFRSLTLDEFLSLGAKIKIINQEIPVVA